MRPEDKPIFLALTEPQLFALNIEREASGEPRDGRIAVGTVVLERVDHRDWDGKTIREVILKRWQFSWTMPEAGKEYYEQAVKTAKNFKQRLHDSILMRGCYDLAVGMLDGTIQRDQDLAVVHCCQYLNPDVAPGTKKEWLEAGMKMVKRIGRHEFFA